MKKKNLIGAGVMALAILAAIPLGANRSFARLREDVESAFYYDSTGYAIYQGLENRSEAAKNLVTLAGKYTADNPQLSSLANELEYQAKALDLNCYWDDSLTGAVENNGELGQAAQALYEALEQVELAEKDQKYPRQLMADLEAEEDKLERSSYNDQARAYNEKLEKFPVSALKGIAGLQALGVFEK